MDTETLPTAPARRVVTRSPVRTVRRLNLPGIFPHPIECESSLERDFVLRAALNPSVSEIRHQPFRLSSPSGRRYTPDFLVTYADGKHVVVEIKLHRKVEGLRSVFDSAKSELSVRGVGFLVLTEREIRRDRAHERAAELLRYRKSGVDPEVRLRLLECLSAHADGLPIDVLAKSSGASRIDVLHLIAKREIAIGKDLAATGESPVFPRNATESEHEVRTESWFEADLW